MYKYEAKHPTTFNVLSKTFPTIDAAEDFAADNIDEFPKYKITPAIIDGMLFEENNTDDEEEYDEEAELRMMGLNDEETSEGFDWTLED